MKKSKFYYLYLCISKNKIRLLKGSKLLHAEVFKTEKQALDKVINSLKMDVEYSHEGLARYVILTFKIN